jgi:superfamily II DNA or RNA helicase
MEIAYFIDARQTIQRLGRILRKSEKKSNLYQVYCANTFEEDNAIERTRVFKDLALGYNKYTYSVSEKEFII